MWATEVQKRYKKFKIVYEEGGVSFNVLSKLFILNIKIFNLILQYYVSCVHAAYSRLAQTALAER